MGARSMKSRNVRNCIALVMALLIIAGTAAASGMEASLAKAVKKPAKVTGLSLRRTDRKIKVSWKKAKYAKKYQVYMKTGTGSWKRKKTLAARTLTVSGAYGKTYRFKVRGVNGKKNGAFSAVKKITIPKKSTPPDPDDGSVTVYFTLSNDSEFVIGKDPDQTPLARVPVKLSYVDLAKYNLQQYYRHPADSFEDGGNYNDFDTVVEQPTAMMLFLKALENWYFCREMTPADIGTKAYSVSGAPTSTFMDWYWEHNGNFMYFVNHEYPLQREGWGSTSDYILLEDGDQLEVGMFSDMSFYGRGGFAFFDQDNPQIKAGEPLTLTMASNGTSAAQNGTTVNPNKPFPYEDIRVSTDKGRTWQEEVFKTDHEGRFTCSFDTPGVYYLSAGPKFVRQGDSAPCIAPPIAVVEVAPGAIEEYRARAVAPTIARYSWGEVANAVEYEVAYKQAADAAWKTVKTDKTTIDISGLTSGRRYQFKVRAVAESDYVPAGEPNTRMIGAYSDVAAITLP